MGVYFTLYDSYFSQVQEDVEDLLVSPGDVIALQHDAGPASLLQCQTSSNSLWRQPVLALNQSDWFWINTTRHLTDASLDHGTNQMPDPELDVKALVEDGEGGWLEDVVCPVRVLYVGHSQTQLKGGQLSAGLPQPGIYSLLVRYQSWMVYPSMHLKDFNILKCVFDHGLVKTSAF